MNNPDGDYWMTADEVADEQRLSVKTLYSWRSKSLHGNAVGPRSTKCGRRVIYRRSDVDAWVEAQEAQTAIGGAA